MGWHEAYLTQARSDYAMLRSLAIQNAEAGLTRPNAEYPWEDQASRQVLAPAEYSFAEFNPRDPKMVKVDRLIGDLLRIAR